MKLLKMKKLFIINASARTALSKCRMLTSAFAEQWTSRIRYPIDATGRGPNEY
jgi:hypothetical protein